MAFQVLGDTVIDQNQIITSPKLILEGTSASESILSGSLNGDSKLEIKADGEVLSVRFRVGDWSQPTNKYFFAEDGLSRINRTDSGEAFSVFQNGSSKASISADGSATFNSDVNVATAVIAGSSSYLSSPIQGTTNKSDRTAILGINHHTSGDVFEGRRGDTNTTTSRINALGSAEFGQASNSTNNNGILLGADVGQLNLYTTRYSTDCFQILNTSGTGTNVAIRFDGDGSATFAGTVDVAGNVAVGGLTVGGSSVDTSAQVDAKIAAIPAPDLSNYDTSTEVTNKINTLLGGAPAALDTLNELAAAIGDDADFASTITGQLSTINTQLSGKADSSSLSNYLRLDQDNTITKNGIFTLSNTDSDWGFKFHNSNGTNNTVYMNHPTHGVHIRNDSSTTDTYLLDVYAANGNRFQVRGADAYTTINGNAVWHAGNDGSGSGLDADKLDGQEGSFYRDASNINAGTFPDRFSNTSRYNIGLINGNGSSSYDKIRVWDSSSYTIGMHSGQTFGWLNDYAMTFTMNNESDRGFLWRDTSDSSAQGAMALTTNGNLCVGSAIAVGGQTTRYLTEPNGQYGSIQINGAGYNNWEGFSIDGRAVFMHNGDAATGIYNDVNNHWLFYAIHNGSSYMYHAGNECIKTVSSTDATIGGDYIVRTAGAGLSKSGSTINIDFSSLSSI